ncbi:YheT family hydrolase [Pseudomonas sp. 5P_3.1_Bac2]|uniref:YheT family hydrolase n=1 Tax=Pseudomonas sp. 5P_3.1_Bac2 TaxID=2971617 RepID=UPI0021C88D10|nr:alpha/beta fold hydrolase [Pseudomonas sp. 5P_3.1_Bac2]MCU1715570.1 alpha/beta fold hydrolase [Pseudomonas sp. 5P_3.1_Bac2]
MSMGWAVLMLGLVAGVAIYYLKSVAKPELVYLATSPSSAALAQLPRLNKVYWPTPWLFNRHLQILGLCVREALAAPLQYDRIGRLTMADGGTTALHWLGLDLPASTPTLVVLPTIAGTARNMRSFVRDLQRATGWRIVVCQRRGHGELSLSSAKFNTMGDVADLREQLSLITRSQPDSPLYAAGISAGTALLIRYLGEQGSATPIRAAFAYCPGYDISVAFARCRAPYSKIIAQRLLKQFVKPNRQVLADVESLAKLEAAQSLDEFQQHLAPCAGYASYAQYLSACNPVAVMANVSIPLLVLNAADDPICVQQNVDEHRHVMAQLPSTILAITTHGSHCAHLSGLRAKPWAHELAAEFFIVAQGLPQRENVQ